MTEQTWAGIVNAPGGNVVQGTQIAEQGDVILVLNSFLSTAVQLSTLEQLSDETFKQINQDLRLLSASYQHFSNLAQNEGLTGDEQRELLEQIRQSCSIFDEIQDARNQFEQIREDTASAVKGQLLQSRLSYLERRIWDRVSKLDLFKVQVAIRTAQEQSHRTQEQSHLTQDERIRAIIESALPSRDAHSVLSKNTFYTARSQLEEERETLRLAEEKLRVALPLGSVEHRSIALEILGEYFHPETLTTSTLGQSSDSSQMSPSTGTDNPSIAVLTLDDGGVRSLTSLLVLRELLCLVALELRGNREPMRPMEIFDVVAGSGTGGLAALLIDNLAMPIDECILHFTKLLSIVFAEPRVGGALWRSKYSIEPVDAYMRNIIEQYRPRPYSPIPVPDGERCYRGSSPDLASPGSLIVCRELVGNKRMAEPVILGGRHDFSEEDTLSFAKATMSVPGYFSPTKIMDRALISGSSGETVNPSLAAFNHLRDTDKRFRERKGQWVNIGASPLITSPLAYKVPRRGSLLIPSTLRDVLRTMDDIQGIAQNSEPEHVAVNMKMLARYGGPNGMSFSRFSVDVGESAVAWDEFPAILSGLLQRRTMSYLAQKDVTERLHQTAQMLAQRYKQRNIEAGRDE